MITPLKGRSYSLNRDCPATLIPAGDSIILQAGTEVVVSQALGGTVTVQSRGMLYRIGASDLDALDPTLAEEVQSGSGEEASPEGPLDEDQVWNVLKTCYDPEIPINIVDLGLIYDLNLSSDASEGQEVTVKMTLTAQGCGMGPVIAEDARQKIESLPSVKSATVEVVWDPPWTPHMISPEGRDKLGLE